MPARPADRGLVARLLETVVAEEPEVAPEVARGEMRAALWLQRPRPDWAGVVVVDVAGARQVVGYAATRADDPEPTVLLVHPERRGRGLEEALAVAAASAARTWVPPDVRAAAATSVPRRAPGLSTAAAPAATLDAAGPEPVPVPVGATTAVPAAGARRPARTTGARGAVLIAASGAVAVLAVQVSGGSLGDALPFRSPDLAPPPALADARPGGPPPGGGRPADADGAPAPDPSSAEGPDRGDGPPPGRDPGPVPPGAPTSPGEPGPTPGPGPGPGSDGPASSLVDPVVRGATGVVDEATGQRAGPVTGTVRSTVDEITDVLDGLAGDLPLPD